MRSRFLTITLAVVLAAFGVVAVLAYVHQANTRTIAGLNPVTVLIAQTAIPAGTPVGPALAAGSLAVEHQAASSVPADAAHSISGSLSERVTSTALAPGQFLLTPMLVKAGTVTASSTGLVIPTGMIAVTVQMCIQEDVANYVAPDSNVAVFDTYVLGGKAGVQRTCATEHGVINWGSTFSPANQGTRLVLASAKVLAIGESPAPQGTATGGTSAVADPLASAASSLQDSVMVTLAVPEAAAEKLILIDELGLPYMALLGPNAHMNYDGMPNLYTP